MSNSEKGQTLSIFMRALLIVADRDARDAIREGVLKKGMTQPLTRTADIEAEDGTLKPGDEGYNVTDVAVEYFRASFFGQYSSEAWHIYLENSIALLRNIFTARNARQRPGTTSPRNSASSQACEPRNLQTAGTIRARGQAPGTSWGKAHP